MTLMKLAIASRHAEATPEVNLLVVGMPNVGKSTLLNSLRNHGVAGRALYTLLLQRDSPSEKIDNNLSCSHAKSTQNRGASGIDTRIIDQT